MPERDLRPVPGAPSKEMSSLSPTSAPEPPAAWPDRRRPGIRNPARMRAAAALLEVVLRFDSLGVPGHLTHEINTKAELVIQAWEKPAAEMIIAALDLVPAPGSATERYIHHWWSGTTGAGVVVRLAWLQDLDDEDGDQAAVAEAGEAAGDRAEAYGAETEAMIARHDAALTSVVAADHEAALIEDFARQETGRPPLLPAGARWPAGDRFRPGGPQPCRGSTGRSLQLVEQSAPAQ